MTERDWFGFRGHPIWHGYKENRPGEARSLCGRVVMPRREPWGRKVRGRSCKVCAAIWSKRYPPIPRDATESTNDPRFVAVMLGVLAK